MAEIRKINSNDEFNEFIKESENGKTYVLKIGSSWCGPCRTLEQTIMELTPDEVEGIMLAEIDADDEWAEDVLAELNVRGIPVLLAYRDGELKGRIQGTTPKDKLLEFFNENK